MVAMLASFVISFIFSRCVVCLKISPDSAGEVADERTKRDLFNDGHWVPSNETFMGSTLKYEWKLRTGTMDSFNAIQFCEVIPGNILFVGDSTTGDHLSSLVAALSGEERASPLDWFPEGLDPFWRGRGRKLKVASFSICGSKRILGFLRSDTLDIGVHSDFGDIDPKWNMTTCEKSSQLQKHGNPGHNFCMPWAHREIMDKFQLLVVNTGAHWRAEDVYVKQIENAVNFLKNFKSERGQSLKVFFRTSVPGYASCDRHAQELPFTDITEAEKFIQNNPWYEGPSFKSRNEIAIKAFTDAGFSILDAYTPTILRKDGHVSAKDCLHFILPGPYHHWNRLLYNLLLIN